MMEMAQEGNFLEEFTDVMEEFKEK